MLPISHDDLDDLEDIHGVLDDLHPSEIEAPALGRYVDTVVRARSMIDKWQAVETEALATAAGIAQAQTIRAGHVKAAERELPLRSTAAEFAAALRLSDRTLQTRLREADDMVRRFPETFAEWRAGRISRRHAVVIRDAGTGIDDTDAREDYERVAVRAAETTTPGRLGPIVKLLAARYDTRSIDDRHATARRGRNIRVRPGRQHVRADRADPHCARARHPRPAHATGQSDHPRPFAPARGHHGGRQQRGPGRRRHARERRARHDRRDGLGAGLDRRGRRHPHAG